MTDSSTKVVARNAIALSARMILTTIVGLYTSRLVIDALGIADYGIYSVVGSVISMAAFLNTSMAGATSRFIIVELECGNKDRLAAIFSTAMRMHLFLALFVVVLGETVGLWFINTQMNFPEGSTVAVNVLYQLSVASVVVSFTQIPYSASIIAHERMGIYAKYEILNALLKLLLVILIVKSHSNRLILYGFTIFGLSLLSALFFRAYCIRNFEETRLSNSRWNDSIFRQMLGFSGYNLIGNMCTALKSQGEPILLNLFFGVVANAAASIAATVTGAIGGMTTTIAQAFRPHIMKQYASGNINGLQKAMQRAVMLTIGVLSVVAIPFFVEPDKILQLWLGQTPPYAGVFLRFLIVCALFDVVIYTNTAALQATGNIRNLSFTTGLISAGCPLASWFVLKLGYPAWSLFAVNVIGLIFITIIGWRLLSTQIKGFNMYRYALCCISILVTASLILGISYFEYTRYLMPLLSTP
ncbi:MAG: polysaccharide biosynthesis protein [Muribaculum sp.]|nr:polysaccharide biosynthesis protein [Muribaculum sp.]